MLHYLSLSDKSWSKCPICYEAVHTGDLKRYKDLRDIKMHDDDDIVDLI